MMNLQTVRRGAVGVAMAAISLSFLAGCGGGGGGSQIAGLSTGGSTETASRQKQGKASVTLKWPVRGATPSKLIPAAANSAQVSFVSNGTVLATQLLVRPDSEDSTSLPTTASFTDLPAGNLTVQVYAYPSTDGSGTAEAQGAATVTIVAGATTPVNLTLGSTIDHIGITPASLANVTGPTTLTATAYDVSGAIVITNSFTWSSSNTAAFTVIGSGSTAALSPVAAGTSTITATETESLKTVTVSATTTNSGITSPQGIAIDPTSKDIYIACATGSVVKLDPSGNYIATFGTTGPGTLSSSIDVAVDSSGNVYAGDYNNHDVIKYDKFGNYLMTFNGSSSEVSLGLVTGVAVDASGNLYVADDSNSRIVVFNASGGVINQFTTTIEANGGGLAGTVGIALDSSGDLWVANYYYHVFAKFTTSGTFVAEYGSLGSGPGQFQQPYGLGIDAANNVYVADLVNNDVQEFDSNGNYIATFGSSGTGPGQFSGASGVAVSSSGVVYASDAGNNRIDTFTEVDP